MSNLWSSIKGIIGSVAPTVATALGGPGAGAAVNWICSTLGLKYDSSPEDIKKAIDNCGPDFWLKLKEFELEYKKLAVKELEITQKGKSNSRSRETEMAVSGNRDYTPSILAVVITCGFFGLLLVMVFHPINPAVKDTLEIMLGSLATGFMTMLSYYFGPSRSSNDKTKVMQDILLNKML